jgi:hypothetical protein
MTGLTPQCIPRTLYIRHEYDDAISLQHTAEHIEDSLGRTLIDCDLYTDSSSDGLARTKLRRPDCG